MKEDVMPRIAEWMDTVVKAPGDEAMIARVAHEVAELCNHYPAPGLTV
jgi:glycine hydroxymethyltransferase